MGDLGSSIHRYGKVKEEQCETTAYTHWTSSDSAKPSVSPTPTATALQSRQHLTSPRQRLLLYGSTAASRSTNVSTSQRSEGKAQRATEAEATSAPKGSAACEAASSKEASTRQCAFIVAGSRRNPNGAIYCQGSARAVALDHDRRCQSEHPSVASQEQNGG